MEADFLPVEFLLRGKAVNVLRKRKDIILFGGDTGKVSIRMCGTQMRLI